MGADGAYKRPAWRRRWTSTAAAIAAAASARAIPCEAVSFNYDNNVEMRTPGTGNDVVDVSWTSVPLLADSLSGYVPLPAGCECLDLAQTNETCTAFKCHETCNLNLGECDEFCCSDPDCTADDVERFKSLGACLPDGSATDEVMCFDTTSLDQVNEKYNMYVVQDDQALEGLLCVTIQNNPIEGRFYTPQADLVNNYAVLDAEQYQPSYSFALSADSDAETGSQEYLYGDNLVAAVQTDALRAAWGGLLSLPTAGPDGVCTTDNYLEFGTDVQTNECMLVLENLAASCAQNYGPLSTSLYGESLYVGTTPSAALNTPSTGWEKVTVGALFRQSLDTGAVSAWSEVVPTSAPSQSPTAEPTAALTTENPTVDPNATATAAPTFAPSPSPTGAPAARRALQVSSIPQTTWDAGSATCANAVVGVKYIVSHNAIGEIASVEVDLTLADVALNAAVAAPTTLTQSFQASFVNSESIADTRAPERVISGNPGYVVGLPVQAGQVQRVNAGTETEKAGIAYLPEGLALVAAGGARGQCFGSSTPWYEVISDAGTGSSTPVLFGVDASSTCTVSLSYSDFLDMTSWCIDRRSAPLLSLGATRVGIYGNANPWHAWEWVTLYRETSHLVQTAQSPVPAQLTCQNMVDRVDLEVLWTKSGEIGNPQPMILSVRAKVGQSDWKWRKAGTLANATQTFTFSQSVTFIEHKLTEEDHFAYKPEIPPLIPAIPADVFYPFDIVSAAPTHGAKLFFSAAALAALALIM